MSDPIVSNGRKLLRFLAPSEKYEIYVSSSRRQLAIAVVRSRKSSSASWQRNMYTLLSSTGTSSYRLDHRNEAQQIQIPIF